MDTTASRNDDTLPADDRWVCAFCGRVVTLATTPRPLCASRTCSCGAVALANRPCDFDEITDDAIGLFAVPIHPESCGYDLALGQDILRSGVEIKPGAVREEELFPGRREQIHCVWFRRSGQTNPAARQQGPANSERIGPEWAALANAQAYDYENDPYCPQCGHWRHPGYSICSHCDRKIRSYCDTILSLMQCGHRMPYGVAYCTICGEKAKPCPTKRGN